MSNEWEAIGGQGPFQARLGPVPFYSRQLSGPNGDCVLLADITSQRGQLGEPLYLGVADPMCHLPWDQQGSNNTYTHTCQLKEELI